MKRRDFIGAIGGAVAASSSLGPRAARAQQMPVIGFLSSQSPDAIPHVLPFFRRGLAELGLVEGKNVRIEFRWAEDHYDRLPALAAEFIRDNVAVIIAAGGNVTALVARKATATIPIVIPITADPVKAGLVESFNRPGGNVTGVALLTVELDAKRIEFLCEIVPKAPIIGALIDASRFEAETQIKSVREAAQAVGRPLVIASAKHVSALLVTASPLFTSRRDHMIALTARHAIPAIFQFREFAVAGGLVSYGASVTDAYHQAGLYAARILKGEKPSDLPIVQPTKFDLVINLKTARALGLEVPPALLARADEVLE
jgi:putative ABC transport system substrate-binding protein